VPPEEKLEKRVGENAHHLAASRVRVGRLAYATRNGFGIHLHRKARTLVTRDTCAVAFGMGTKPPIKRDL
jgi:hypothetical protein